MMKSGEIRSATGEKDRVREVYWDCTIGEKMSKSKLKRGEMACYLMTIQVGLVLLQDLQK